MDNADHLSINPNPNPASKECDVIDDQLSNATFTYLKLYNQNMITCPKLVGARQGRIQPEKLSYAPLENLEK